MIGVSQIASASAENPRRSRRDLRMRPFQHFQSLRLWQTFANKLFVPYDAPGARTSSGKSDQQRSGHKIDRETAVPRIHGTGSPFQMPVPVTGYKLSANAILFP